MSRRLAAVAAAVFLASSCGDSRLEQRCRYEPERVVVEGGGSFIRAVALSRRGEELLAAWTDRSGTSVLRLESDGVVRGRPHRIGPPASSIDLIPFRGGWLVAMLRPGHVIWGGGGALTRRVAGDGAPAGELRNVGRAGAYSAGISAIVDGRGRPVIAWQDGTPGDLAVRVAMGDDEPIRLSPAAVNGCCPDLVRAGSETFAVWGQYEVERVGATILARALDDGSRESARVLARTTVAEPWPVVTATTRGVGMVYRDRRRWDTRDQLIFRRFDESWSQLTRPQRLGRYDGLTEATLLTNGAVWVSLAVRSWSREWIVALDRFRDDGERIGAELHVFGDHVRFTDVSALRLGSRYLVLYAEDEPRQRLLFSRVSCW